MMLQVENITAAYSGIEALRGVSLHIEAGEMVALIGANGAGKSTLLNCLSGTVRTRGGKIRFDGADITGTRPHRVARRDAWLDLADAPAFQGHTFPADNDPVVSVHRHLNHAAPARVGWHAT